MKTALGGLTSRGRGFLAAGICSALVALALGQTDLLRVAVLLIALPLVCAVVVSRTRYRVACTRKIVPTRVPIGTDAEVVLALENVSRLPTGLLMVHDQLPYSLGTGQRFVVDRVEPRGTRRVRYSVSSQARGRFLIGPLSLHLADPFGMCELERSFRGRDLLTVTPVVHPLPYVPLGGEWAGSGDSSARRVAAAGEDDVATREYRHGDDLRRVHWRSTARYGELMVRREEQPWQSRCTVLLDNRAIAHRGEGPTSSFEWAVSAAASVSMHLAQRGFAVRLLTADGVGVSSAAHDAGQLDIDFEGHLLDALTAVERSDRPSLAEAFRATSRSGEDGLLVAVTGRLSTLDASSLGRIGHGRAVTVAIVADSPQWGAQSDRAREHNSSIRDATTRILRGSGCRVVEAGRDADLATLWTQAAHDPTRPDREGRQAAGAATGHAVASEAGTP